MYDAIVVGARCAGSPTAMLLARRGYRVLLVDRASFPSDTLSVHYIHQPGMARLKRWGLLDRVIASNCPPVRQQHFNVGPFELVGAPPPADGAADGYAPRRTYLDKILVDAAAEAGVEVREQFSVQELTMDGDRVTGIRGHAAGGATVTEQARIVIGADGMRSMVARAVAAPAYNEVAGMNCTYYSYWRDAAVDTVELYPRPGNAIAVGPTNDGLTLAIVYWNISEFHRVRADIEGSFMQVIDQLPTLAPRLRAGTRVEPFRGTGDLPNFFRQPYGPGWALVGDAGFHKDPILAQGITDAFRDADLLADAIDAGFSGRQPLDEALAGYQRQRDEQVGPMYENTLQMARLEPPPPDAQQLFAALRHNQPQIDRFIGTVAGTVPLAEFFSPENIMQIMASAQGVEMQG